jgi:hypothetical protein
VSFWNWLTRRRPDHGWPGYIINGRIRTSTAILLLAFFAISWLHNAYQPTPTAPTAPGTQMVPGFPLDPAYTWVPRTYVQPTTTTTTPTTTTTETSPTETSPTETSPTVSPGQIPTTVIDPDGSGPLPPQTIIGSPTTTPTTVVPATPTTVASTPVQPPLPAGPPR